MLNISVIPQRKYNLAPSVINKLYNPQGAKVASVTSLADKTLHNLVVVITIVFLTRYAADQFLQTKFLFKII